MSKLSSIFYTFNRNQREKKGQCLRRWEPLLEPNGTGSGGGMGAVYKASWNLFVSLNPSSAPSSWSSLSFVLSGLQVDDNLPMALKHLYTFQFPGEERESNWLSLDQVGPVGPCHL